MRYLSRLETPLTDLGHNILLEPRMSAFDDFDIADCTVVVDDKIYESRAGRSDM